MCVVQAVPFTRSVPGGSQNDGRGVGERTGSRYMSTNVNEQDIAHWTLAKVWASGHKNQGPREKARYFLKNTIRTNKTFYKLIAFTHGTRIRFLVSDALHQVRGGAVWQFVSARKVRAPVYAVQYYTKTCGRGLAAACTGSSRVNAHSTLENAARQDSNKPRCGTLDSRVVIVVTLYQVHCIFVC